MPDQRNHALDNRGSRSVPDQRLKGVIVIDIEGGRLVTNVVIVLLQEGQKGR